MNKASAAPSFSLSLLWGGDYLTKGFSQDPSFFICACPVLFLLCKYFMYNFIQLYTAVCSATNAKCFQSCRPTSTLFQPQDKQRFSIILTFR